MFDERRSGLASHADSNMPRPVDEGTDEFAIAGLVCAVACVWPAAIVFCILALPRIKRSGRNGRGLAIAGLVVSGVGMIAWVVAVILLFVLTANENSRDAAAPATSTSNPFWAPTSATVPAPAFDSVYGLHDDCFSGGTADGFSVDRVDCDLPHDKQIYYRGPLNMYQSYPGGSGNDTIAAQQCDNAVLTVFGDRQPPSTLRHQLYFPTKAAWDQRARSYVCVFFQTTGQLTGRVRG